jgi:peptide/nickel transport system substrate-binding protein
MAIRSIWRECYAYWVCGSIIESGYQVVLIGGADVPAYNTLTLVTANRLKKIGINVDLQLSDWGSVSARRAKKDPPGQGGWNLFHTSANGAQLASPLVKPSTIMTCDGKNFVGWPCDEKEEALRQEYIRETDPEKQKASVEAMHRRLWEVVPYVPLGQLKQPFLWRKNISGVLKANTLVFWNIEKNERLQRKHAISMSPNTLCKPCGEASKQQHFLPKASFRVRSCVSEGNASLTTSPSSEQCATRSRLPR